MGIAKSFADFYQPGVRYYVPRMACAGDMIEGKIAKFSLGTPAASDDDLIDASIDSDATAGTEETQTWVSDSPYGRNLIWTVSGDPGAAGCTVDVYGTDYLGQQMTERFTVANTITAIQYGKKCFYRVSKTKIVTAATNAITSKLGTGTRLGLPYKGSVEWASEDGSMVTVANRVTTVGYDASDAEITSGFSAFIKAPFAGYVQTLRGLPSGGGSTTNAATTVELGGTAIVGLTVTMDQDTTTEVTDTPTTTGYNANNRFVAGGLIEIVHAATTSGGACRIELDLVPTQATAAVTTDPQTTTTGDPRGSYEPIVTMDAVKEILIGLLGDASYNSSGNGGLHGIAQV